VSGTLTATFMRGGTSKALMFRRDALPADRIEWDPLLLTAMGSPDPYGRQLNGMGGGLSSLSKVCVVGPSERAGADVDFTFAQVQIGRSLVDYSGNCGNMSAAIGPFALHAGLIERSDGDASVLVHNTNTAKLMRALFAVREGLAVEEGDFAIPGVAGAGAPVRLDFLDPGGSATGTLLPTGSPIDELVTPLGTFTVSIIDSGNVCVFLRSVDLGLTGMEPPEQLDADTDSLATIATIRAYASVAMGLTGSIEEALNRPLTPFIAVLGAPGSYTTSDGQTVDGDAYDLSARFVSNGQPHRAVPGTGALCLAVAARLPGTVAAALCAASNAGLRVGTPAGVVQVEADVEARGDEWHAVSATSFRTFRRLFTGQVFV
jgi:2-methylaconitate cis-trans-isomerase PrpF